MNKNIIHDTNKITKKRKDILIKTNKDKNITSKNTQKQLLKKPLDKNKKTLTNKSSLSNNKTINSKILNNVKGGAGENNNRKNSNQSIKEQKASNTTNSYQPTTLRFRGMELNRTRGMESYRTRGMESYRTRGMESYRTRGMSRPIELNRTRGMFTVGQPESSLFIRRDSINKNNVLSKNLTNRSSSIKLQNIENNEDFRNTLGEPGLLQNLALQNAKSKNIEKKNKNFRNSLGEPGLLQNLAVQNAKSKNIEKKNKNFRNALGEPGLLQNLALQNSYNNDQQLLIDSSISIGTFFENLILDEIINDISNEENIYGNLRGGTNFNKDNLNKKKSTVKHTLIQKKPKKIPYSNKYVINECINSIVDNNWLSSFKNTNFYNTKIKSNASSSNDFNDNIDRDTVKNLLNYADTLHDFNKTKFNNLLKNYNLNFNKDDTKNLTKHWIRKCYSEKNFDIFNNPIFNIFNENPHIESRILQYIFITIANKNKILLFESNLDNKNEISEYILKTLKHIHKKNQGQLYAILDTTNFSINNKVYDNLAIPFAKLWDPAPTSSLSISFSKGANIDKIITNNNQDTLYNILYKDIFNLIEQDTIKIDKSKKRNNPKIIFDKAPFLSVELYNGGLGIDQLIKISNNFIKILKKGINSKLFSNNLSDNKDTINERVCKSLFYYSLIKIYNLQDIINTKVDNKEKETFLKNFWNRQILEYYLGENKQILMTECFKMIPFDLNNYEFKIESFSKEDFDNKRLQLIIYIFSVIFDFKRSGDNGIIKTIKLFNTKSRLSKSFLITKDLLNIAFAIFDEVPVLCEWKNDVIFYPINLNYDSIILQSDFLYKCKILSVLKLEEFKGKNQYQQNYEKYYHFINNINNIEPLIVFIIMNINALLNNKQNSSFPFNEHLSNFLFSIYNSNDITINAYYSLYCRFNENTPNTEETLILLDLIDIILKLTIRDDYHKNKVNKICKNKKQNCFNSIYTKYITELKLMFQLKMQIIKQKYNNEIINNIHSFINKKYDDLIKNNTKQNSMNTSD